MWERAAVPNRYHVARVLSSTSPSSTTLFPVVRVSVVALQLHKAIRMMEDFPPASCDDAWLRVHGLLSSLRSRMLWLNDHSHEAPHCPDERDVTDLALALAARPVRKAVKPAPHKCQDVVCHLELKGGGAA